MSHFSSEKLRASTTLLLIPLSYPAHTPLIPLSYPSQYPSHYPSHTPLIPLSYAPPNIHLGQVSSEEAVATARGIAVNEGTVCRVCNSFTHFPYTVYVRVVSFFLSAVFVGISEP